MPRTLHAAITVQLPVDEFEAAAVMSTIAPHWAAFTKELTEIGIRYSQELKTAETKARMHRRVKPPLHIALAPAPPLIPDEDDAA
jgi:hypothetical protein